MLFSKPKIITSILILTVLYFVFLLFIQDMEGIHTFVNICVSIVVSLVGFKWVCQASLITKERRRRFWLIIAIGLFFFCVANFIWLYMLVFFQATTFPIASLPVLVIAYVSFLVALLYKIKTIEMKESVQSFFFTISVFVTFIIVVHIYYFVQPIMSLVDYSKGMTFFILVFQICTLSILFANVFLFYISRKSMEKDSILFLVSGMFFHMIGVILYFYFSVNNMSVVIAYSLWTLGLLFFLLSAKLVKEYTEVSEWKMVKYVESKESILPYIIILILLIMLMESYHWKINVLMIGMIIMLLMIIGRQWYVMQRNKELMQEYSYLAFHDTLTELKNRTKFTKDLETIMEESERTSQPFLMFLMDLDQFKSINDTMGHNVGDRLLSEAAKRLKHAFEPVGTVYRIGGDEFVIIVPNVRRVFGTLYAKTILHLFSSPFIIKNHTITISPSIGISVYPDDGQEQDTLLHHTDAAMYLSKQKGKAQYCYFNQQLYQTILRKRNIEVELKQAIEFEQFSLYFQPKINLTNESVIGFEAFIRWDHPRLGLVSPREFIPIAEETGYIFAIDEWVLLRACEQFKQQLDAGRDNLTVSVNVSAKQLEQTYFGKKIKKILEQTGIEPKYLELEITESEMGNIGQTIDTLNELHAIGVRIAIDNFGIGYSSLHILQSLPFDTIKIDQSFVSQLEEKENISVIKTIIDIGLNLNMEVIAEGIETAYQARTLANLKCDYGQGYFFSKPLPIERLSQFLEQ
ncbi:EAL domain-containing protein [Paraliobacillus sp. JSM ZJ581]|uniref:EAL domain-containing protein n=1 Tax=Paraliobacillus sp. JSM ZJ581 TaxID=3342118 RepID=UPI0035A83381